jgi:hypothetical protein
MTRQEKAKDARLKREFGVNLDEYNQVLKYQVFSCAICKRKVNKKGRGLILCVDHCHKKGLVRGLLCWTCNKALAIFQDDVDRLLAAAEYIKNPPFTVVLGREVITAPGRIGSKARAKVLNKMRKKGFRESHGKEKKSK